VEELKRGGEKTRDEKKIRSRKCGGGIKTR
jgi:hypothetical protein